MEDNTLIIKPSFKYFILNNWYVPVIIIILFYFKDYYNFLISTGAGIICILLLLKSLYNLFFFISIRFTITDEMIVSEYGFFRRTINYMELYRIYDYQVKQSLFENALGLMSVYLIGRDLTNPTLKVFGVNFDIKFIPNIRTRVEVAKRNNNIYELNQM